jgi:DNA repair protein RadC
MTISNWPLNERPREKLLDKGASSLSDAELLAIFLRTGCRGKTAVDLARSLLQHFGSLRTLLHASSKAVCAHVGLGKTKFAQLAAITELNRRYLEEPLYQQDIFKNSKDTIRFLNAKLRHLEYEVFACLFLDNRNYLIAYEEICRGTHNKSTIYPREIIKRTLELNAAAIIFAHNHPSGHTEPSTDDRELTAHLQKILASIDVQVFDHLIIGHEQSFSFAQAGWL